MAKQISGTKMNEIADMIRKEIPGLGFALIIFPFGKGEKYTNYISNAQRADMIKAFEETLQRWKNKDEFPTPETN